MCNKCENSSAKSFPKVSNQRDLSSCEKCTPTDASCVNYTGPELTNLGAGTNTSAEHIFQVIDRYFSGEEVSWSFDYSCLDDESPINSRRSFVESVSYQVCQNKSDIKNIEQTMSNVTDLEPRVEALENPKLTTNSFVGIVNTDSSRVIVGKLATRINEVNEYAKIDGVNWSVAYPVTIPPVNIKQGFDEVLRQITLASQSGSSGTLPTFNTTSSCLPTKTPTTSLKTTVDELVVVACSKPSFDFSQVTWNCVTAPTTQTLQDAFQRVVSTVGGLVQDKSVFDSDQFDVTPLSNCQGQSVSIKPSALVSNGKVFVDSSSTVQQFLREAFVPGDNVEMDVVGDKIEITAVVPPSNTVGVTQGGLTGYLDDVLESGTSVGGELSISKGIDGIGALVMTPILNEQAMALTLLTTIQNNPTLLAKLCNMMCGCQDC